MKTKFLPKIKTIFNNKYSPLMIIILAGFLVMPSLIGGEIADDWIHHEILSKNSSVKGLDQSQFKLFTFSDGESNIKKGFMEEGVFAWWASKDFKLSFFRPISCLTHMIDYELWKNKPWLKHLHSILWYILLIWVISVFFQRFFIRWIAVLGLFLYALDDAHGFTVSFTANRNAIIAAVFAFASLLFFDKGIRESKGIYKVLSPIFFFLALFSSEAALAILGFYFGYLVFYNTDIKIKRFRYILPHSIILLFWSILYILLDFGTKSSGIYLNPLKEPFLFLKGLINHAPILFFGQIGPLSADVWSFVPRNLASIIWVISVLSLGGFFILIFKTLNDKPVVKFMLTGSLIALLPISATFPSDRLLIFTGVGAMGFIACLFASHLKDHQIRKPKFLTRSLILVLFFTHLIMSPLLLPFRALTVYMGNRAAARVNLSIPMDSLIKTKDLVIINSPLDALICYLPFEREVKNIPRPRSIRLLSSGSSILTIFRPDQKTLQLELDNGFLEAYNEKMMRGGNDPFHEGEEVKLSNMRVKVLKVNPGNGLPKKVEFAFKLPLEDPSFLWMIWEDHQFVEFTLPKVGENKTCLPRRVKGIFKKVNLP